MHHPLISLRPIVLAATLVVSLGASAQSDSMPGAADVRRALTACASDADAQTACAARFFEHCAARRGDTTVAMVACQSALAAYWDEELNRVYQTLIKRREGAFTDAVRQTQRAWIGWRDQRCQPWANLDGSMYRIMAADCYAETVHERVKDLQDLLDAVEN